jgi:hypothetical protein
VGLQYLVFLGAIAAVVGVFVTTSSAARVFCESVVFLVIIVTFIARVAHRVAVLHAAGLLEDWRHARVYLSPYVFPVHVFRSSDNYMTDESKLVSFVESPSLFHTYTHKRYLNRTELLTQIRTP